MSQPAWQVRNSAPSIRSIRSKRRSGVVETSERVLELDRRIAEVERSLATLKQELAVLKPEQVGLDKLKAIVDLSEVRLEQMRAERAKLREQMNRPHSTE